MTEPATGQADAQAVEAPLSQSAVFLVVTVHDGAAALDRARSVLGDVDELVKTVGFRSPTSRLSCIVGVGRSLWDRLSPSSRPAELRPFTAIAGARHHAPATPGDLLFHIRSERTDLCFELERLLLDALGDSVGVADEVAGFRYFDSRDLLGFVDGTANPTGTALRRATIVGDEDPGFAGGSYVVVQKYLHDLEAWNAISTAEQEAIIGRTKPDNVEIDDDGRKSHRTLNTIVDDDGDELDILRDNMPFGRPGHDEFGTYFIGYSRRLWVIETMLEHMFVGEPIGSYDRILDVSAAVTGTTFFAPSLQVLEDLAAGTAPAATTDATSMTTVDPGAHSLRIGSLKPTTPRGDIT